MTSSADRLPPALSSMWRLCKLGYRHEPGLLVAAFLLALLAALPDALLALWFKLLGEGVLQRDRTAVGVAAVALGVSAAATWFLRTVSTECSADSGTRSTIALESHVARLQASVVTIAHHERPDYLDRLSVLRDQVFVLDHMYMSLFSTCGWILRLGVTIVLLMSIHPALILLAAFSALPTVLTSTWRPAVERVAQERGASSAAGLPVTCLRRPRRPCLARKFASPVSANASSPNGARHGRGGTVRYPKLAGVGRLAHAGVGDLRGGVHRCRHLRRPRAQALDQATCCWCWRQGLGFRRTSGRRSEKSGSSAASGWTARAGSPGSRITPPR